MNTDNAHHNNHRVIVALLDGVINHTVPLNLQGRSLAGGHLTVESGKCNYRNGLKREPNGPKLAAHLVLSFPCSPFFFFHDFVLGVGLVVVVVLVEVEAAGLEMEAAAAVVVEKRYATLVYYSGKRSFTQFCPHLAFINIFKGA